MTAPSLPYAWLALFATAPDEVKRSAWYRQILLPEMQKSVAPGRAETQETITDWANATFGVTSSNARVAARANEEMSELLRALTADDAHPKAAVEIADIVIVLYRLASRLGTRLDEEVDRKMAINRTREWKKDGTGHGYHVRDKGAEACGTDRDSSAGASSIESAGDVDAKPSASVAGKGGASTSHPPIPASVSAASAGGATGFVDCGHVPRLLDCPICDHFLRPPLPDLKGRIAALRSLAENLEARAEAAEAALDDIIVHADHTYVPKIVEWAIERAKLARASAKR